MIEKEPEAIIRFLNEAHDSFGGDAISGSVILNYGSSTRSFFKYDQPYIYTELLCPLRDAGAFVLNIDPKHDSTVLQSTEELPSAWFPYVIATSLFEHVGNPKAVLSDIARLIKKKGFLVASVPSQWAYHPDPIDTMLRLKTFDEWDKFLYPYFVTVKFEELADVRGKETIVLAQACKNGAYREHKI